MNTKSEMSEIRALTTDELDLVCGAATPVQFQVDLGNMKIGGYADEVAIPWDSPPVEVWWSLWASRWDGSRPTTPEPHPFVAIDRESGSVK